MSNYGMRSQGARLLLAFALATIPLGISLFFPPPPLAHASTFTVNNSGDASDVTPGNNVCETGTGNGICTLRAAIQEANVHAGADTINITVTGTIALGTSLPWITQDLTINGPGASLLTISGNNASTVMLITSSAFVNLSGVTIANGYGPSGYSGGIMIDAGATLNLTSADVFSNTALFDAGILNYGTLNMTGGKVYSNTTNGAGGGVTNSSGGNTYLSGVSIFNNKATGGAGGINNQGSLTIINSSIYSNSAGSGGGISNIGTLTLTTSYITYNVASNYGAGLYNDSGGSATVDSSTFDSNNAGFFGGALSVVSGSVTILNTQVERNTSPSGGGINLSGGAQLTVANTTFFSNTATSNGGGLYISGATAILNNTTLISNSAQSGAGLRNGGILTLTNSTFKRNTASNYGGAIRNAGTLWIVNTTIYSNTGTFGGGGIFNQAALTVTNATLSNNSEGINNSSGTSLLRNTIVASSNPGGNCSGTITNGGNNIDSGATCAWGTTQGSMSDTDPLLGPLANNGGSTETMALLSSSPAINGVTYNAPNGCPSTDQRGVFRPQAGRCDIGAYEVVTGTLIYLPLILK